MKRGKKGEWTDVTERRPGYTDARPLTMVFRGENGLVMTLYRISPNMRWQMQCPMFDLFAEELAHVDTTLAQSQAIGRVRRELQRINEDLDIAARRIA